MSRWIRYSWLIWSPAVAAREATPVQFREHADPPVVVAVSVTTASAGAAAPAGGSARSERDTPNRLNGKLSGLRSGRRRLEMIRFQPSWIRSAKQHLTPY